MLDCDLKHGHLRRMLEWRIEIDHNWSLKPGAHGRGLANWLAPERWAELEGTYAGAGFEESFAALLRTIELFRKVAVEVGDGLGYAYPHDLHRRMLAYLNRVRSLERHERREGAKGHEGARKTGGRRALGVAAGDARGRVHGQSAGGALMRGDATGSLMVSYADVALQDSTAADQE